MRKTSTDPPVALSGGRAGQAVLIAYDGSAEARVALERAAELLAPRPAVVLTVWRSCAESARAARAALPDAIIQGGVARLDAEAQGVAQSRAEEGAARARERGLEAVAVTERCDAAVSAAIVAVADELAAGAIVLGTRGIAGARSLLAGSVTRGVARRTTRPLLIVGAAPARRQRAGQAHFLGSRSWSI